MLYEKIKIHLSQNNINIDNVIQHFKLRDDGQGAFIESWSESNIGFPQPTKDQLDNVTEASIFLQNAKDSKIAEIKKAKNEALYLPVEYNGNSFYTSEKANINILGVIGIMDDLNLPAYPWRSVNGEAVNLTLTDFKQLRQLIGSSRGIVYGKEADKTTAINNALTIEEVNSISWDF